MTQQKKWYQQNGADYDVVLSTRVRLARNLRSYPFPSVMNDAQRAEVNKLVRDTIENGGSSLSKRFRYIELDHLKQYELVSLVERHLVSPNFVRNPKGRALMLLDDESVSIMICEEDHLRIQAMKQGLALDETYELANRLDTLLSERLDFAADRRLGYLTACPTNLGTAMRASVMMHLIGLDSTGALRSVSKSAANLGLTIRGLYGEGSQSSGSIFQLSNQETLGVSEKESLSKLTDVTAGLIKAERDTRKKLMTAPEIQDRMWRALGVLRSARMLSGEEFIKLFSVVRMGAAAGVLEGVPPEGLTALFIDAQPATLMQNCGKELTPVERDTRRADLVRQFIG